MLFDPWINLANHPGIDYATENGACHAPLRDLPPVYPARGCLFGGTGTIAPGAEAVNTVVEVVEVVGTCAQVIAAGPILARGLGCTDGPARGLPV
jgi:hypothetical protein